MEFRSVDPLAERRLLKGCRAGDPGAVETLFKEHRDHSYRLAYRLTGSHADADDVLQHAWLQAFQGLANFDGRSRFATWFYRIVVHAAVDRNRKNLRKRFVTLFDNHEEEAESRRPESSPIERAQSREFATALDEAIGELPADLRAAVTLVGFEQMSYREAAEIQRVPEGTLAWRVSEARKRLAEKLGPFLKQVGGHEHAM